MTVDTKKLRELAKALSLCGGDHQKFDMARWDFRAATGPDVIVALCDRLEAAEKLVPSEREIGAVQFAIGYLEQQAQDSGAIGRLTMEEVEILKQMEARLSSQTTKEG